MNTATHFYVQRLLEQLARDCEKARLQIRTSPAMRQVKQAAGVHAHSIIRALPAARQAVHQVHLDAERRMGVILEQQLRHLATCAPGEQSHNERSRLLRDEWQFLRGEFASLFVRADRDSLRILHAMDRRLAVEPVDPDAEISEDDDELHGPAP